MSEHKKYDANHIRYVQSGNSAAVLITRDRVKEINTNGMWIDVIETKGGQNDCGKWDFFEIVVALYPKRTKPVYVEGCNAKYITWMTAVKDIEMWKRNKYQAKMYRIKLKLINKNKGKQKIVEKVWNKKFERYVPEKWWTSSCERRKVKVPLPPQWEYVILKVEKL